MKCEHCGKNEVTFVFQSNLNGQVTERHLCGECAEKLGFTQKIAAKQQRMMQNFFGDGFFGGFFAPSLMGRLGSFFGEDLLDDFFADMPALSAAPVQQQQQQQQQRENLVDEPSQSRFSALRARNALKLELKQAVHQENFERAAELRDQLRAMEKEQKSTGESA